MVDANEITHDTVLGGRVRLSQPRVGYRAGLDAALLAAAVRVPEGHRVLDLGCGVGGALLPVACRNPGAVCVGVERDAATADLARRNVADNGWADRIEIVTASITDPVVRTLGAFDTVLLNPPFFDDASTLRAPHPARVGAYMADDGLAVWLDVAQRRLRSKGQLAVIHRADRLADILKALEPRCGAVKILPLYPFAGDRANRVVVVAQKGSRAALQVCAGMILHQTASSHTHHVENILRGKDDLPVFA
jgi:tRNA1(Val) A37 N6-methylase TrmN6